MTPNWALQVLWFGAGIGATGAVWYFLSQQEPQAALWSAIVAGLVVLLVVTLHIRNDRIQKLPEDEKRVILPLTAEDMRQFVRSVPALSRKKVANEVYRGRWVSWQGKITNIREADQGYAVHIEMLGTDSVQLIFPQRRRAEVEALREGDSIEFEGRILNACDTIDLVCPQVRRSSGQRL